jgi:hypothetical protein
MRKVAQLLISLALVLGLSTVAAAQISQPTGCPAADVGSACLGSGGGRADIVFVQNGAVVGRIAGGIWTWPTGSSIGPILLVPGTVAAPSVAFAAETGLGFYRAASGQLAVVNDLYSTTVPMAVFKNGAVQLGSTANLSWSATADATATADVFIRRSAANALTIDTDGAGAALSTITLNVSELGVGIANGGSVKLSGAGAVIFNTRTEFTSTADKLLQTLSSAGTTGEETSVGSATLGTCTGGTITTGSHNFAGGYTGNTSSSCVINFGTPNYTNAPFCVAMSIASTTHPRVSAASASSITITGGVSGEAITYICRGRIGT